jgi:DNA-binding FadR family transcriptional regulator
MSTQFFPGLAALATRCEDKRLWERLIALRASLASRPGEADDVRAMIESEVTLGILLAEMTANPLQLLVQHILIEFGDLEQELKFYRDAEDRRCTRQLQVRLCDAVLARDEEDARAAAMARLHMLGDWIDRY